MSGKLRPLELRTLGPPAVLVDGEEAAGDVLWRKHVALLVYLALSPHRTRSREHLLGLLWPEKDEARARHSLNEAVRRLRAGLGSERIVSKGDAITLNGEALHVDALDVQPSDGEFLDGLALHDAPAFEDWLAHERTRLRQRRLSALLESGEQALSSSDFLMAQEAAHKALAVDAEAEAAIRLQMRAAALRGDSSGALGTYRTFVRHLEQEYGEKPSRELRALAERIREGRWRRASLAHTQAEPALVGRRREHETAFSLVADAADENPRVLVVAGLAGMGKTRLLAECVNRWRLDGGAVAVANPLETDPDVPWSTLRQIMHGGLLDAPGLAATDPTDLRMLAGVVPSLAQRFEPMDGFGYADIGDALGGLLEAVTEEIPLAIAIDDAHRADEATLFALRGAFGKLAGRPTLLLLGVLDQPEAGRTALMRLVGDVGRRLAGSVVLLEPFSDAETRELVDILAPWCGSDEQRARLTRRVTFETSGDPFLAVSLLRGLAEVSSLREDALVWPAPNITLEAPVPFDIPQLVRAATLGRVQDIGDVARQVLVAACIGDRNVDPGVVRAITDLDVTQVESGLVELERRHLVSFDGERYMVEAALLREVILSDFLTPGQRSRLQSRYDQARDASR